MATRSKLMIQNVSISNSVPSRKHEFIMIAIYCNNRSTSNNYKIYPPLAREDFLVAEIDQPPFYNG